MHPFKFKLHVYLQKKKKKEKKRNNNSEPINFSFISVRRKSKFQNKKKSNNKTLRFLFCNLFVFEENIFFFPVHFLYSCLNDVGTFFFFLFYFIQERISKFIGMRGRRMVLLHQQLLYFMPWYTLYQYKMRYRL